MREGGKGKEGRETNTHTHTHTHTQGRLCRFWHIINRYMSQSESVINY